MSAAVATAPALCPENAWPFKKVADGGDPRSPMAHFLAGGAMGLGGYLAAMWAYKRSKRVAVATYVQPQALGR